MIMYISTKTIADRSKYKPFNHRYWKPTLNLFEAFVLFAKGSVGAGLLNIPLLYNDAGLVIAICYTVSLTATYLYSLNCMLKCRYLLCVRKKVPRLTYQQTIEAALETGPKWMGNSLNFIIPFCDGFMFFFYLGVMANYQNFMAERLLEICAYFFDNIPIKIVAFRIAIVVPCLLISSSKYMNFRLLLPRMVIGLLFFVIAYCIVSWSILHNRTENPHVMETYYTFYVGKPFHSFMLTIFWSLETCGMAMQLQDDAAQPARFMGIGGILVKTILSIMTMVIIYGCSGIWYNSSNMNVKIISLPHDHWITAINDALLLLGSFLSYPMYLYVPFNVLWNSYLYEKVKHDQYVNAYKNYLCYGLVTMSALMALGVPDLDILLSMVNSMCLAMLTFSMSGVVEICVLYPDGFGRFEHKLFLDLLLVAGGLVAMVLGCQATIDNVYKLDSIQHNMTRFYESEL